MQRINPSADKKTSTAKIFELLDLDNAPRRFVIVEREPASPHRLDDVITNIEANLAREPELVLVLGDNVYEPNKVELLPICSVQAGMNIP